jgi:hypothetical protein
LPRSRNQRRSCSDSRSAMSSLSSITLIGFPSGLTLRQPATLPSWLSILLPQIKFERDQFLSSNLAQFSALCTRHLVTVSPFPACVEGSVYGGRSLEQTVWALGDANAGPIGMPNTRRAEEARKTETKSRMNRRSSLSTIPMVGNTAKGCLEDWLVEEATCKVFPSHCRSSLAVIIPNSV